MHHRPRLPRKLVPLIGVTLVALLFPSAAQAHDTGTIPDSFWSAWSLEPYTLVLIWIAALWYWVGVRRLREHAAGAAVLPTWRIASFYTGLALLLLALVSPLHVYGEYLISVHMVQHMVVTMIVAPLIVLGDPFLVMLWGFPSDQRRTVGRQLAPSLLPHRIAAWLLQPPIGLIVHVTTVLIWHLPPFYEAAVHHEFIHYLQHTSFIVTSMWFWWPVIDAVPARRTMSYPVKLLYLFFAMLFQEKLIGGILTFVRVPIYPHYAEVAHLWNTTGSQDQQLAGIVMMVGGAVLYFTAFTAVFFAWAHESEKQEEQYLSMPTPVYRPSSGQTVESKRRVLRLLPLAS